jgi:internalin A
MMMKIWRFGSVLIGFTLAFSLSAQRITIKDPGLEAAVRAALHKPAGGLSASDMESLTKLVARAESIQSLQGLEWATKLTVLDLSWNQLASLTFPGGLTNLETLHL